jgi:hypothetical protein
MAQPPPSARGRRAFARMGWEGGNPPRIKDPLPRCCQVGEGETLMGIVTFMRTTTPVYRNI